MISLILPYWNRQKAANEALALLDRHYREMDLEIIVIDDGSTPPFEHDFVKIIRLPEKKDAQATCVPINRGVEASKGDIIALSGVEMLHKKPVLQEMLKTLKEGTENTYVSAAVWCPEQNRWHAHSSIRKYPLHFMTMMNRSLWDRAGGFDEDYREGVCFDDDDFVRRLLRAGMNYVFRDDLVVTHPRRNAKGINVPWRLERNRKLFEKKWPS